jgi:hypothetical protein
MKKNCKKVRNANGKVEYQCTRREGERPNGEHPGYKKAATGVNKKKDTGETHPCIRKEVCEVVCKKVDMAGGEVCNLFSLGPPKGHVRIIIPDPASGVCPPPGT